MQQLMLSLMKLNLTRLETTCTDTKGSTLLFGILASAYRLKDKPIILVDKHDRLLVRRNDIYQLGSEEENISITFTKTHANHDSVLPKENLTQNET